MNQISMEKKERVSSEEREAALESDKQWNLHLARTFQSESGRIVLEKWKRLTVERRIDLILTNPQTGQRHPNPQEAIFARLGDENFIKDILTRIERAKQ